MTMPNDQLFLRHSQVKLDLEQLELLSSDEPTFKNQILEMLLQQTKEVITKFSAAKLAYDPVLVFETAHKFKSSVHIISQQTHDHFKVLERDAKMGIANEMLEDRLNDAIKARRELELSIMNELNA